MLPLFILTIIVIVSLMLGSLTLFLFLPNDNQFDGDWLAFGFASLILGVSIIGWLAFVLAEIGQFSILALSVIGLILFAALLYFWSRQGFKPPQIVPKQKAHVIAYKRIPQQVEWLLLIMIGIVGMVLFLRPHQFIRGAADAGVYVNLSAEIARTGQITIHDDLLAEMDAELAKLFLRELNPHDQAPYYLLPAFYVMSADSGEITPQFYHLHPVWQAIAHGMAGQNVLNGINAALSMTALWALMSCLAIYLVARSLFGWQLGLFVLIALLFTVLQVWFARYPTTEAMSQFLLWSGIWASGNWLWRQKPERLWAFLTGLCFGLFFILRIDTALIVPILGLFVLWLWLSEDPLPGRRWFIAPLILLFIHSLIHGYWQSRPYFLTIYGLGFRILFKYWGVLIIAGVFVGVGLIVLYRFRTQYKRLNVLKRPLLILLIVLFLSWAGYNWFLRPYTIDLLARNDPFSANEIPIINHENFIRLGWYLSPIGIWLGVIGICIMIWQVNRRTIILLSISLLFTLVFIQNIRTNPLQIYTMRRYMVATVPVMILGAVAFIYWLIAFRRRWLTGIAVVLTLVWLASLLWSSRGFISQVDYKTLPEQLQALDSKLADNAILLFNDQAPIGQGDLWGTPMRFLFDRDVYTIRNLTPEREALLDEEIAKWQATGHAVYWIDVPTAQMEYRPTGEWTQAVEYVISFDVLEQTYDHKPVQVNTQNWKGTIFALEPASP